ncbi:glycosyltransferase family 2 protein [Hyphomicrobiales bacterium 4NK60-0047b]
MSLVLSVVVPCFNEEDVLLLFYNRMKKACDTAVPSGAYEIIIINDGSTDNTWQLAQQLVKDDPKVVAIDLFRNHGHQLAVTAGLMKSKGSRVMMIDADLQDPPELLEPFMKKIDEGFDVVYGQRKIREGESVFKRFTAKYFYRILSSTSTTDIPLDTGDFRLMTRKVVDQVNQMQESHRFLRGMVAWVGGRQVAYQYDREKRAAGETKYTLSKMVSFAADAITGFSTSPLRLAIYVGIAALFFAMILMAYVIISYVYFETVPGWASLGCIFLMFSSVQLIILGFIGDYIGRIFVEVKGRPLINIRQVLHRDS